ncbi:TIGR01906 family membrane protein [Streptococcus dentiloxodontae]
MKTKIKSFITPIWLLSVTILITIYLAWGLYWFEIDWLKLMDQVIIGKAELWNNFNELMSYLTNPFVSTLNMPDFPSSDSGLGHFQDVKHLFHLVQVLVVLLAYPAGRFLRQNIKNKTIVLYHRTYTVLALLPIVIGVMGLLIGFDAFFTLFHQVLFPGDSSWLFNPYTDPIIEVLPEDYFLHCFILFFIFYELIFGGLALYCKHNLKRDSYA